MKKLNAAMAAAAILLAVAGRADAQDASSDGAKQTVEGAQDFLALVMPAAGYESNNFRSKIQSYKPAERCSNTLRVVDESGAFNRNFGDLQDVSVNYYDVKLAFAAFTEYYKFNSQSMATRVGYALEFLHAACDKTAGTGF